MHWIVHVITKEFAMRLINKNFWRTSNVKTDENGRINATALVLVVMKAMLTCLLPITQIMSWYIRNSREIFPSTSILHQTRTWRESAILCLRGVIFSAFPACVLIINARRVIKTKHRHRYSSQNRWLRIIYSRTKRLRLAYRILWFLTEGFLNKEKEILPYLFKKEYNPPAMLNDPSAHTPVHHVQSHGVEACEMRIIEQGWKIQEVREWV